ncbi:MAG: DUF1588 domain-containing protein [Myxococcales bacterium]|nr:DUF1588 domain-containing protein [Myxococcales bacterium]
MRRLSLWAPLAWGLLAAACAQSGHDGSGTGSGDAPGAAGANAANGSGSGGGSGGASGGGGSSPVSAASCTQSSPGTSILRLLTRAEFDRTMNDIFPQLKGQWTDSLPSDTVSDATGFDNDGAAVVGNQLASALLDTALSIATAVTGTTLATTLPCAATSADHACAETFLGQYGRRLFRRSLTSAEHDRYLAFFDASKAKSDFPTALKWMTVGLIQSPSAVYRREIGVDAGKGVRNLNAYEIATELAYTYGGSTPSADLLAKADSGNLGDLVAAAKSLLATDAGKQALQHFFDGYLAYTRITSVQKPNIQGFAGLGNDMLNETRAFIDDVVFQKGGGLKELLTAPTTNPSQRLAQYYGFPAPSQDYGEITRPSGRGLGILAQASFLATHANANASSPTQRGLFPYLRLFCHQKLMPPDNVPAIGSPQPGVLTTRQRYENVHAAMTPCSTCHKHWDPIGFGFEHFDEGGRYRDTESGLTIDSSSDVPNDDLTPLFTFKDEETLVTGLAQQPAVYDCFTGYLATYAFGTSESCLGAAEVSGLKSGTVGIADSFAKLVAEPHFTTRTNP